MLMLVDYYFPFDKKLVYLFLPLYIKYRISDEMNMQSLRN